MIDLKAIKSLDDWSDARKDIRTAFVSSLGSPPKQRNDTQLKIVDEFEEADYTRYRVNYFAHDWERVSAWLFVPDTDEEIPGILCCHSQTELAKAETAGLEGDPLLAFAKHYAQLGFITLAPDCVTAGERVSSGLEPFDPKAFYKENKNTSLLGRMLFDHIYALDALEEYKRVDGARLGVIGHGLGGTNALTLAAFDERVQACVASAAFSRFQNDPNVSRWSDNGGLVLLPKLRNVIESGDFPWDWEHALALAAPSAVLVVVGENDDTLGNPESCSQAVKTSQAIYRLLGAPKALSIEVHRNGNKFPREAQFVADDWFERWL